jgi:TRIAD3 protein (E3 ubiquitin-protein ligase RNF216)
MPIYVQVNINISCIRYLTHNAYKPMCRECYQCHTKYVKEEGCNKMTCPSCGAKMCYLCKEPVKVTQNYS